MLNEYYIKQLIKYIYESRTLVHLQPSVTILLPNSFLKARMDFNVL